ncbi:MAG TPA: radical SAM protein [bacterium]|nr:radical SAM protein [bacterium]
MKILFVHLGRENLGIEYLSSILKEEGHDVHLAVDIGLFGKNDNIFYVPTIESIFSMSSSIVEKYKRIKPDMVCFSVYTGTIKWALRMAERLKLIKDVPVIMGGVHVTLAPESVLLSNAVDFGVRGEGETVIAELAKSIENNRSPEHLAGIIYRNKGEIKVNGYAPPVKDLDALPFPDKSLFEHSLNIADDYMTLPARGCPYSCTYCCEQPIRETYGGEKYCRLRSVDNLLEELKIMKSRYKYSEVYFCSPIFPYQKEWIEEFSRKYPKEIGVPFWCYAHIKHADAEIARLLVDAGCFKVEFGLQTVNEDLRRKVFNRNDTNVDVSNAFSAFEKEGLPYDIGHIVHIPGETEDDYRQAVRFYSRFVLIHRIKVFTLTLFPGTRMLESAIENGWIDKGLREKIYNGESGDYFHSPSFFESLPDWKIAAYSRLISLTPILPRGWAPVFLSPRLLRLTSLAPKFLIRLAEMLYLIGIKDLRMRLYLKLYLRHIAQLITRKRKA